MVILMIYYVLKVFKYTKAFRYWKIFYFHYFIKPITITR